MHAGVQDGLSIKLRYCEQLQVKLRLIGFSCIANSQAATSTFFTNLARWKFLYENRLIDITRESYDILVCK